MGVGDRLCRRSGDPANDHEESDCNRKPKCVNCEGDHVSISTACDFWRKEKEIVTVKHKESFSFPEARKKIETSHVLPNSYSSVLKTKIIEVKDANTQTIDIPSKTQVKENISKNTKAPANRRSLQAKRTDSSEERMNNSPKKQKKQNNKQTKVVESDRLPKGCDDPIQQHNRFSCLPEDMEADSDTVDEKSKQSKIT